jgi:branched-chain amino acid transport system ATP-binding protein
MTVGTPDQLAGGRADGAPTSGVVTPGPAALSTVDLTWHVGGAHIVEGVSLDVAQGEFVAVIGPNGAGKTSLLNMLSGLRRPSSGQILLRGRDITNVPVHTRAHLGIGRSFQSSAVFGSLSVRDNVRLAVTAHRGGSLRAWPRRAVDESVSAEADRILAEVGLGQHRAMTSAALSHGDKRKLEIALMLAGRPSLILLDEPMAGVSAEDVPGLADVVRRLSSGGDCSVIMVEHHVDVVLDLADRIAVMHHGALLICADPATVMADDTVQAAYLGEGL